MNHMSSLRAYQAGFSLALSELGTYRINFFFGRLREFILFGALLFLFQAIPHGVGDYSPEELMTYILGSTLISSLIFVHGMHRISFEIADGDLTNYLVRPVRYLPFWFARLLAPRSVLLLSHLLMILLFFVLFPNTHFIFQKDPKIILSVLALTFGAISIVQMLDFIAGLLAFWTNRAHGPRWLMIILIQFLSGAYLPLDLLPHWLQKILFATPFPSLIHTPLQVYLSDFSSEQFLHAIFAQLVWIGILGGILYTLWKKGVQTYEAYGR